jgi:hypothetical protein
MVRWTPSGALTIEPNLREAFHDVVAVVLGLMGGAHETTRARQVAMGTGTDVAIESAGVKLVPVGPPNRYEEALLSLPNPLRQRDHGQGAGLRFDEVYGGYEVIVLPASRSPRVFAALRRSLIWGSAVSVRVHQHPERALADRYRGAIPTAGPPKYTYTSLSSSS